MAGRRMVNIRIIDSDNFLELPLSTQALYFHLLLRADDDGFINNPKRIQRMIGGSEDDFKLLIAKQYILTFSSGSSIGECITVSKKTDITKQTVLMRKICCI